MRLIALMSLSSGTKETKQHQHGMQQMRKLIRYVFLGTMLTGLLLTGVTTLLTGCAASPDNIVLPAPESASSPPTSVDEAIAAKNNAVLQENIAIWEQEQSAARKDTFTEALAAYHIGSSSGDHHWSLLSTKLFDAVLDKNPDFVLARAWRGSAHAKYAGNYPIKGVLLVIPGPGFVRLEHVRRAFRDLNDAVEAAPNDPVVRLVRASTFIGMPGTFGGHDVGAEDFAILDGWTDEPASNPRNADVLAGRGWRSQYFLNRARSMAKLGKTEMAREAWRNLLDESDDPADRELARWHLK